jgi:hypothetical protein
MLEIIADREDIKDNKDLMEEVKLKLTLFEAEVKTTEDGWYQAKNQAQHNKEQKIRQEDMELLKITAEERRDDRDRERRKDRDDSGSPRETERKR